ncbi:MAG: dienelactone hydrolase family protein, partial [Rhodospirillales bacterium]
MHGCGGLLTSKGQPQKKYRHWAGRFHQAGFATLAVDSFTGRGIREICTGREKLPASRARTADALAALARLRSDPRIDPQRIGLAGWSNGGRVVLHLLDRPQPAEGGFRFAIGFYANVMVVAGPKRTRPFLPSAPLLLLTGEADDWTPARNIVALQAATRRSGSDFAVHLFPGAHHSFDSIGADIRYRPEVRNASKPGGCCGATVGYNAVATLAAEGVMMNWINNILRQN